MLTMLRTMQRIRRSGRMAGSDGITVLELTVAAALVLVVVAPAMMFMTTTQRNQINNYNATGQQADARTALQEMTRFLREAEYPGGTNFAQAGSDMFANTLSNEITFYSETQAVLGSSGTVNGLVDKVDYTLSGTSLIRTVTTPDCSVTPCSYDAVNDSNVTVSQRTLLTDVKNQVYSGCTNVSSATNLFSYERMDPATGQIEPLPGNASASDINYVQITIVTGLANNQPPGCTTTQTAVSLRNWRPQ